MHPFKLAFPPTRLPSRVFFRKLTLMAVSHLQIFRFPVALTVILGLMTAAVTSGSAAYAQDPVIERLDASNLMPGQTASIVVNGKQLTGALSIWTPAGVLRPKEGQDLTKDQPVTMEGAIAADTIPGIYPARFVTNHGCSEAAFVVVDDLPSVAVAAESEDRNVGQLVPLPCCLNGQLNAVRSKFFRIAMAAGQTVCAEVFARRLGSDMDPVLRVTGPDEHEVAYRDDMPGAEGDTQLQFTAAVDGEYRIEVRDVRFAGGSRYYFHLRLGKLPIVSTVSPRIVQTGHNVSSLGAAGEVLAETMPPNTPETIGALIPVTFRTAEFDGSALNSVLLTNQPTQAEAEPNNSQAEATSVSAESHVLTGTLQETGDADWFKITTTEATPLLVTTRTREVSSPTDVKLELFKADGGRMAENDDAGPRDAELAAQLPEAGEFFLKVSEIAGRGGPAWTYALDFYQGRKAVRVTAPADRINVPRGGSAGMQLTVKRIHYEGPVKVEAAGLPAAIQMAPFVLGAKQSTAPVVLTATDPAATTSDADWGAVSFKVGTPEGSEISAAEFQLAPPAPKKQDNEVFRSARMRTDLFTAVQPAAQFSFTADPAVTTVVQGATATVTVRSTRAADWTMPIEIALATPADQLPPGITVTAGSMAAGELAITITAAADAAVGPFSVFLQGKAKKDNVEPVIPIPAISIEVKAP
jgi:hypothetical protein